MLPFSGQERRGVDIWFPVMEASQIPSGNLSYSFSLLTDTNYFMKSVAMLPCWIQAITVFFCLPRTWRMLFPAADMEVFEALPILISPNNPDLSMVSQKRISGPWALFSPAFWPGPPPFFEALNPQLEMVLQLRPHKCEQGGRLRSQILPSYSPFTCPGTTLTFSATTRQCWILTHCHAFPVELSSLLYLNFITSQDRGAAGTRCFPT